MRAILLAGLLLVSLLGGCLDPGNGPEEPGLVLLHLHGNDELSEEPDRGETVVEVVHYLQTWAAERPLTTFGWAGPEAPLLVTGARLTLTLVAPDGAASPGPQDQGLPELGIWLGNGMALTGRATTQGPDQLTRGERVTLSVTFELPRGGLVADTGSELVLALGAGYVWPGSEESIGVVSGGPDGGYLELETAPLTFTRAAPLGGPSYTGSLSGPGTALGELDGVTFSEEALEVPEGTLGVAVTLQPGLGAGAQDLDLEVIGPDGNVAASGLTPRATERVLLFEPNLDAIGTGTWTIRVTNFGYAHVTYQVLVTFLVPPPTS